MAKLFSEAQNKKDKKENTFHKVMAPILRMSQIFGLFPITGIFSENIKNIQFKFLSTRTLHTALWIISAIIFLFLELKRLSDLESINAKSIGNDIQESLVA